MHLGRNNPAANYNMMSSDQQNYLVPSKEEKDLHVWVDDGLILGETPPGAVLAYSDLSLSVCRVAHSGQTVQDRYIVCIEVKYECGDEIAIATIFGPLGPP